MDAVEGAEGDGTRTRVELARGADDPQVVPPTSPLAVRPIRASACSGGRIRPGSASATVNGPTSVRRRVTQWPPSSSAMARTYVRAIAEELGGHCVTLRRTEVGPFTVAEADPGRILPPEQALARIGRTANGDVGGTT